MMKLKAKILFLFTTMLVLSCSKSDSPMEENVIVGQWFLVTINDTAVSSLECYQESYIRSDGQTIEFYLVDLMEDGSCNVVLNSSENLTIEEDFYYIDNEAIEIYIEGNTLSWRVDFDTTLIFQKI